MSNVVRLSDHMAAKPREVQGHARATERLQQMRIVQAMLQARIDSLEAGKPVDDFGAELARAFAGLPRAKFVSTITAVTQDLLKVCESAGFDPQPFRGEVQQHAICEFDQLTDVAGPHGR